MFGSENSGRFARNKPADLAARDISLSAGAHAQGALGSLEQGRATKWGEGKRRRSAGEEDEERTAGSWQCVRALLQLGGVAASRKQQREDGEAPRTPRKEEREPIGRPAHCVIGATAVTA
ncbi:hypothetical protein MRX96_000645 [Rhipicephalus microplus]